MWIALYLSLLCGVASTAPLSCDHACTVGINTQGCICISGPLLKLVKDINNECLNQGRMVNHQPRMKYTEKIKRCRISNIGEGLQSMGSRQVLDGVKEQTIQTEKHYSNRESIS